MGKGRDQWGNLEKKKWDPFPSHIHIYMRRGKPGYFSELLDGWIIVYCTVQY